jgi:hypothetical protein
MRSAHGFVGVLAAAALTHPALQRAPNPRNALPASLLTVATFGGGWWIYASYRSGVKHKLLAEAYPLAMAFEVKEHLAFVTVILAVGAAGLLRAGAKDLARRCYQTAALLAWAVIAVGWLVSGWG